MTFTFTALLCLGVYSKPSLSAKPSPVVTEGENVTLQCDSQQPYLWLILTMKGPEMRSWTLESEDNSYTTVSHALFSVGPVTSSQRWTFRCYSFNKNRPQLWSEPSDPLELLVSGIYSYDKPSLSVLPSPVVTSGGNVTLKCVSSRIYDKLILTKEDQKFLSSMSSQYIQSIRQCQALFFIDHVTPDHRGTFRCYGYYNHNPQVSAPVELTVSAKSSSTKLKCVKKGCGTLTNADSSSETVSILYVFNFNLVTVINNMTLNAEWDLHEWSFKTCRYSVWVPENGISSRETLGMIQEGNPVQYTLTIQYCFQLLESDAKQFTDDSRADQSGK
ncbi:hypothetical protein STEG23_015426 [Scotinomys teguina]